MVRELTVRIAIVQSQSATLLCLSFLLTFGRGTVSQLVKHGIEARFERQSRVPIGPFLRVFLLIFMHEQFIGELLMLNHLHY